MFEPQFIGSKLFVSLTALQLSNISYYVISRFHSSNKKFYIGVLAEHIILNLDKLNQLSAWLDTASACIIFW